ncbi:hypothetical protein BRADI_2g22911v3 [Brachypodium distachyon]|uniref:DUF4220 domain-containing protein n=1 Tax=Brachypodium distachyon TaxID=15368 RepID=A0A2K2D9Y5_BRADI|nr:hypothetical protein BRADI_2g22911v3 [Brachypodium distachyon]
MAGAEFVVDPWKQWGLQALVLLSFVLQVTLLILAQFRRCVDSSVLRVFVWSAYTLADATAIYVLGHLSVTAGGQDNITAYAIEDNRLWLRHLQTLAVQVVAAAYVIYQSSIQGRRSLLWPATILVLAVGVVKYGERVWALKRAGKGAFPTDCVSTDLTGEEAYKVVEMQLSLMHDVFYTKTPVMHSWHGLCSRIISLLATASALLLFQLQLGDHKNLYSTFDIAVTYVLLVGPGPSSWRSQRMHRLARVVVFLRRLVHAAEWRRRCCWSRSMGQHNMLQLCAGREASRSSKLARRMGAEDPWNIRAYSCSIPVSAFIEQLMVKQVLLKNKDERWSPDQILMAEGREALKRWGLYGRLSWSVEESILVWHLSTDLYLRWYKEEHAESDLSKAVEALSNYMLFLLAARPEMLPPPADRNAYVQTCYALLPSKVKKRNLALRDLEYSSAEDPARSLRHLGKSLVTGSPDITFESSFPVLIGEDRLAGSSTGDMLELIVQVWLEMLFYVGCRCTAYSHAKQLSNGSELITAAALLAAP